MERKLQDQRNNLGQMNGMSAVTSQMVPDERCFQYMFDQFGKIIVDQMGAYVIDTRNGIRVNPVDQYGNFMPFPVPQYYYSNFAPRVGGIVTSPVNIVSSIKNINDLPIKIRYSEKDFNDFRLTSESLAKYLLDKAKENHPEIRYSITPNAYGFHEMSIFKINPDYGLHEMDIFKRGVLKGVFILDLEGWGGKGLPIMHGIVGNQYGDNHIIVPLGATRAVEECMVAIAYDTGGGVDAITQAKFEHELLPEYIYGTIDFGVTAFPDGLENYKQFGKVIEHIDKYYELNTRYRLYGYKNNFNFTLVSDEFVKPFHGQKAPLLHESIVVENNTLTIKQPNGNTKVVQMGA